jgi:hypothetical protein
VFERPSEAEAARYAPLPTRRGAPPMKRVDGILSSWAARIRASGAPFQCPAPGTSIAAVGGSVRPRRGGRKGAVGVLVLHGARRTFTPGELAAAYEDFVASGPRYLDAESGIEGSVYRFGTRALVVYEEPETGMVVLVRPTP